MLFCPLPQPLLGITLRRIVLQRPVDTGIGIGMIASMKRLPEHKRTVTVGADGDLRFQDLGRGKFLRQRRGEQHVRKTIIPPGGKLLIAVTGDWAGALRSTATQRAI